MLHNIFQSVSLNLGFPFIFSTWSSYSMFLLIVFNIGKHSGGFVSVPGLLFFPVSSLLSFALCSSPSPPSHPRFRRSVCLSCSPCWLLRCVFLFLLLLFSELVWVIFRDPFSGYLRWVSFPILSPFWAVVWGLDAVFYLLSYRWLTFPVWSWDQQHQFMKGILAPPHLNLLKSETLEMRPSSHVFPKPSRWSWCI